MPLRCISLYSYIKPQPAFIFIRLCRVVYLYIPTSNHNRRTYLCASLSLYIFIFLHQTTTCPLFTQRIARCISLYSYIKPQPFTSRSVVSKCCISLYSYIKPQRAALPVQNDAVVYLYIPTSNHN